MQNNYQNYPKIMKIWQHAVIPIFPVGAGAGGGGGLGVWWVVCWGGGGVRGGSGGGGGGGGRMKTFRFCFIDVQD